MDLLKYTRETWPIEQMSHKSRRSDEGSNGEYFPRTIDKAVLVSLDERLFIDGYPVLTNENAYDAPDGTHYEPGELLITKYLPDGTENPLYDDLSFSKTPYIVHSDTDLHEALNGLEQRMIYMENNGVGFNSVGKEQLKEGAVDNRALGTASVDSSKIADGSIAFQDLNPYTVEQIIDSAVTDAYDIAKDSKTLTFDPDTKKLEVRDAALEKQHFSDKAFDEHYDLTSDGALKNKVVTATFGDIICDESQEGTSADSHGLKITKYADDENPDHNDKWVIGEDIADSATTTVSELIRHIANTDIIVREPKTTEWQIVNEESKEVPYEDFKAEVVTDVTDAFDTKIADYTYNKTDIDAKINNAGKVKDVVVDGTSVVAADGVATIALTGKADKATTYTKDEVDTKLEDAIKIENVKIPNATDPTAGETLPIVDKAVTIPVATGSMFGAVKYGTWDALKSGEIPNPADIVGKVNAKANSIDVYNKVDADNKFMPKTTFKTINGEAITGTGDIVIETPDNMVVDVLINGTTVVDDATKVAKIELASTQQIGVVGITNEYYNPAVQAHLVPSCESLRQRDTVTNKAVDGTTVSFDQYATGVDLNYKLIGDDEATEQHTITLPYASAMNKVTGVVRLSDSIVKDSEDLGATVHAVYYDTVENVAQHVFDKKFNKSSRWSKRDISVSIDLAEEIEAPAKFVLQYIPSQFDATKAKNLIAEFRDINGAVITSMTFDATTGTSKTFEIPSSAKKIYSIIIKGSDYSIPVSAEQAVLNMSVYTDFVKELITDRENRTPVIEMADGIDLYETRPVSSRMLYQNMPFHLDDDKNVVPVTGKKNVALSHIGDSFVAGTGNVTFGEGDVQIEGNNNLIGTDGGSASGINGCFIMANNRSIDISNSDDSVVLIPSSDEASSGLDSSFAVGATKLIDAYRSYVVGSNVADGTSDVFMAGKSCSASRVDDSAIIGVENTASECSNVFAFGANNTVAASTNYIVGDLNNVSKQGNVVIGRGNTVNTTNAVIIGNKAKVHDAPLINLKTSFAVGAGVSSEANIIEVNGNQEMFIAGIGGYQGTDLVGATSLQAVIADLVDRLVLAETYLEDAHNDIVALQATCHELDERLKALEG